VSAPAGPTLAEIRTWPALGGKPRVITASLIAELERTA
jgi:hypothetical protein